MRGHFGGNGRLHDLVATLVLGARRGGALVIAVAKLPAVLDVALAGPILAIRHRWNGTIAALVATLADAAASLKQEATDPGVGQDEVWDKTTPATNFEARGPSREDR